MLANYLKISIRNLLKYKIYSFINIFGLATGVLLFLTSILYVQYEAGYDEFHTNKDRIFRVIKEVKYEQGVERRIDCGAPLSPLLKQNFPQIEKATRFFPVRGIADYNDKNFEETKFCFVDNDFLSIFSFKQINGEPSDCLNEPFSIIITEKTSEKYFGTEYPINKIINLKLYSKNLQFKVTGVLKDIPANSHLKFDFLASFESIKSIFPEQFFTSSWETPIVTYIMLSHGANPEDIQKPLSEFAKRNVDKGTYLAADLKLQSLRDIYFKSGSIGGGRYIKGDEKRVLILTLISLLVLVIAGLNYINLSTARAMYGIKEVGIRKVLGSSRFQVIYRFMTESFICVTFAVLISILLIELILPVINNITGLPLTNYFITNFSNMLIAALVIIVVSGFAGFYPAINISASSPGKSMKSQSKKSIISFLRKAFVVFQFAISVILIFGSVTIYQQVDYLKNKDLGFEKENITLLSIKDREILDKYPVLKSELNKIKGIKSITASSQIPGLESANGINISSREDEDVSMPIIYVDFDYLKSLGLKLKEGRDFNSEISSDEASAILVNERFSKQMLLKNPVGKHYEMYFKEMNKKIPVFSSEIIGVLKDFNFRDLTNRIQPVIFKIDKRRLQNIII